MSRTTVNVVHGQFLTVYSTGAVHAEEQRVLLAARVVEALFPPTAMLSPTSLVAPVVYMP